MKKINRKRWESSNSSRVGVGGANVEGMMTLDKVTYFAFFAADMRALPARVSLAYPVRRITLIPLLPPSAYLERKSFFAFCT